MHAKNKNAFKKIQNLYKFESISKQNNNLRQTCFNSNINRIIPYMLIIYPNL